MANITMEAWGDTFTDAATITAAREAIGIWLTQASSTNALTITGSGALTLSSGGAYTVTVPGTGTMVLANSTATLTNKTFDTAGTGNSFLINGLAATANTGTGSVVRATSPTLVTPVLGVATCTSINGLSITGAGGSLIFSGPSSLTIGADDVEFTTAGSTNITLPTTGTMATLAGSEELSSKTLTSALVKTGITPTGTADTVSLGSTGARWLNLYMSPSGTINFNNGNWVASHSSGILTVGTGDLRVTTAGTNTASVVTVGGTQTLTSKTLTTPTITTPNITTPAISTGGEWGGTPNFAEGITSEGAVDSLGNIVVSNPAGKVGYTTGAGGSVSSGSVTGSTPNWAATLNTPVGSITIPALTTAAGAEEYLTVTNSRVDTNDIIIVSTTYNGAGTPLLSVSAVGSGTFIVNVSNCHSANAFNNTLRVNFAVIKGVVT